jgi:hypothetical protein
MLNIDVIEIFFIIFILIIPPTLIILAIYDFKELKDKFKNLH